VTSARRAGTTLLLLVALAAPAVAAATPATATTTTTARKPATTTTSTSTTTPPEAARQSAIDTELRTLRQQVEEASAEEADVLDKLDAVAASKRSLDRQVADLDTEIAGAEQQLADATAQLATVTSDLQRAEVKYTAPDADLDDARDELTDRAVRAYVHQPGAQLASVLLERQSFLELAAARDFLRSLTEAQARSVERYRSLRATIAGERRSLTELRDSVSAQRDVVAGHRDELLQARARQDALRVQAASEEGRQQTLLKDVRSKVKEYEAQIAALKKESDAIAAALRARQKASQQKAAPSGKGVFSAPVGGAITSTFGNRRHPIFGTMRMHTGVDFSAPTGTPVRAAADGVVFAAGERSGYGNTVILDHGNTLATLYGHLSRIAVADGATVTRGQVLGYSGSTGYSTGPHLHFEVRVSGNPVDPLKYL
jgi:murein DD-endopeptidase MepM/ murein hydrolase activator NlpD